MKTYSIKLIKNQYFITKKSNQPSISGGAIVLKSIVKCSPPLSQEKALKLCKQMNKEQTENQNILAAK